MNKRCVFFLLALVLFSLQAAPTSASSALTLGVATSGSLSGTGAAQTYEITVPAGLHLFVILDAADNGNRYDLYLRFGAPPDTDTYDARGALPNADQVVEVASTQAGTYYLLVHATDGGGAFMLTAHIDSTLPTLTLGVPRCGMLQDTYDIKVYRVAVSEGEHLFGILDAAHNHDTYDLYGRFGALPTTGDYDVIGTLPTADQAVEFAATQAGTYYFLLRSTNTGGHYCLIAHTDNTLPELTLGSARLGVLQSTDDAKFYRVGLEAGEHLFGILDAADNDNTYELYVRYGALPDTHTYNATGVLPNADQAVEVAPAQAGNYYMLVRSAAGGGAFGLTAHTDSTLPALILGSPRSGILQDTYDTKFYRIAIGAGTRLLVTLDGEPAQNTYDLHVRFGALPSTVTYDLSGEGDHADRSLEIPATQAGTYYLLVRSTSGGGGYQLLAKVPRASVYIPLVRGGR